ncbi:hypothetical protein EYF80_024102 [Liparis tanakae]|uniref:Uncharacterized protein n=1 Tax=Liparis tanakae TaxID=230148 RepID=A0A4Z2HIR1_9TELE|nr:hypothetical protein EYF80_024102 [Liparis tanakae]
MKSLRNNPTESRAEAGTSIVISERASLVGSSQRFAATDPRPSPWNYATAVQPIKPSSPSHPQHKLTSIPITSVHSCEKLSEDAAAAALSARGSSEGAPVP